MLLTQGLHRSAQRHARKIATRDGARSQTFAELILRVAKFAGGLHALGVRPGDRVAMLALNSDHYLEYLWATWWLGAVTTPINTRWSASEIVYSLNDCATHVLIVDDAFANLAAELRTGAAAIKHVVHAGDASAPSGLLALNTLIDDAAPLDEHQGSPDALAAILYTGGTTGFPKGVMLSHANLWSAIVGRMAEVPNPGDFITLLTAPLFHVAGLGRMIGQTVVGGTCVTVPRFQPSAVLQSIERFGITDMVLVPSMIQMLLDEPTRLDYDLSSLRRILWGAAPIAMPVLERAMQAWQDVEFIHAYGMTETGASLSVHNLSAGPHARANGRAASAGRPGLAVDVRIVNEIGQEVPRGTTGELIVSGPTVMQGYWKQPEATQAAVREGWLYTGDGAYMDDEGYLYVVDRIKDMIISGGENIYPAEVETVLARHPAVALCAVIGVPHAQWGETVHAVVVLKEGLSASEQILIDHCRTLLGGYKCPRSIAFRTSLPLSAAGKVLKKELRTGGQTAPPGATG